MNWILRICVVVLLGITAWILVLFILWLSLQGIQSLTTDLRVMSRNG